MKKYWQSSGVFRKTIVGSGIFVAFILMGMYQVKVDMDNRPQVTLSKPTLQPDSACDAALRAAATEMRQDGGETELKKTGDICKTKAEWTKSLEKYPEAFGITDSTFLDGTEVRTFCTGFPETRICKD